MASGNQVVATFLSNLGPKARLVGNEESESQLSDDEGVGRRLGVGHPIFSYLCCVVCGEALPRMDEAHELSLWANQEWQPIVCGTACGEVLTPYTDSDYYLERSARQDEVTDWIERTRREKGPLPLPVHLVHAP